ncbi:MAG: D-aminoacyl-tRNA deacylase [Candidatus Sumerlaeota bacterium]|nr:D-aminoacyl-tRNA deacylase [Candidatus Sumerlaeota bacterium]
MRALIQRVREARVEVDGQTVGRIGAGLLVFAAAGHGDGEPDADLLARKIAEMRIFADEAGRFNRSLFDIGGAVLLVSQFTLYADCRKGRRPSFTDAAAPADAEALLARMAEALAARGVRVETGRFGAMMDVHLVNDGPVTIWLDTKELRG